MKTITFYSYKGGSGRSLTVANAALYLQRLDFRVTVIDFDLEAPGMHYKFAFDPETGRLPVSKGLVDYVYQFVTDGTIPEKISDFALPLASGAASDLRLIPAGNAPEASYWQKLSRINWHELFYSEPSNGVELFFDLKNKIDRELKPDFLLIDSRTGITETGGVATSLLADRIICLVSPSRENLEGARSVLQSVNRTRRGYQITPAQITIALSRLPEMEKAGGESEVIKDVLKTLNRESETLEDTLNITEDDAITLHSEKALEIREALRIGSGVSPEDSILLRDYLRLFASIVPQDLVVSKLQTMLAKAREKIWENPTEAVKEVEELAESFGHPDTYRELLRFYEVRNIKGPAALRRAQRLWEISRYYSSDEILWNALASNFPPRTARWQREGDRFEPRLDFVEAVWRDGGKRDPQYGLRLIDYYDEEADNHAQAISILTEMVDNDVVNSEVIAKGVNILRRAGEQERARSLIERFRNAFAQDRNFITAWAKFAHRYKDTEYVRTLLQPPLVELLQLSDPMTALLIMVSVGLKTEAVNLAERSLSGRRAREYFRNPHDVEEIFQAFTSIGLDKEISRILTDILPNDEIKRLQRRFGVRDSDANANDDDE